ncbi:GNAT family acetyltransferase [Flavobacterium sp. CHNK8]|uniref:GNAT family acetyltransferase n=1 Tax=Flavobacterium sp. CHNK8 TaxID=2871165 RepID=UPI001C8D36E6|nr:GNAT family acetyltransferase [Flavobacterium sp. CHNK8]QZK89490.1 GNAT family acetyltransferase [Flavobacterium sp. CHNK8]
MTQNLSYEIAQISDIDGVLALQELYLVANLTETEKAAGFVTTPFTISQLNEVIEKQELFIAKDRGEIIGYIFAGSWDFFKQWPIFEYMSSLLPELQFLDHTFTLSNSFQYGPISIHQDYRGKGLIFPLFEHMRVHMSQKYPLALTFINKINIPSTKAHTQKLNWSIISEFQFNNNDYYILAYDMNQALS